MECPTIIEPIKLDTLPDKPQYLRYLFVPDSWSAKFAREKDFTPDGIKYMVERILTKASQESIQYFADELRYYINRIDLDNETYRAYVMDIFEELYTLTKKNKEALEKGDEFSILGTLSYIIDIGTLVTEMLELMDNKHRYFTPMSIWHRDHSKLQNIQWDWNCWYNFPCYFDKDTEEKFL